MSDTTPAPAPGPTSTADMLLAAFQALRSKQWIKNLLVFAALVFALKFTDMALALRATMAFASFCLISSAGYLFNDARDVEADRMHPKKCKRPIAAGRLPIPVAYFQMAACLIIGMGIAYSLSFEFLVLALMYFATTMSYTFFFKHSECTTTSVRK